MDDLDDSVEVTMTPEGSTWDAYDQTFAENERSMTNRRGQLRPPKYVHTDFVEEDDMANINSIMAFDTVNRCDKDAVIAAFDAQDKDVEFTEKGIDIGYCASEIAAAAVKPFSSDWNPVYENMPVGQDQVSTIILSVSNSLDPQTFYDALKTQTVISKFKMLVGGTSIVQPEEVDDLWLKMESWNVTIDISSLENIVDGLNGLDQEVSAMATRAKGVTPERLSKIWSIDIETAKRTIGLTSQYLKYTGNDHLKSRYSTNNRMLWYKRIQSHFFMDTFQVTAKAISEHGNRYMQLFVSDAGFMYVHPMKAKTEIIDTVKAFAKEIIMADTEIVLQILKFLSFFDLGV